MLHSFSRKKQASKESRFSLRIQRGLIIEVMPETISPNGWSALKVLSETKEVQEYIPFFAQYSLSAQLEELVSIVPLSARCKMLSILFFTSLPT